MQKTRNHATKLGAEKIFISAIPSTETIAFYLKMGCVDANEIVGAFVDSEKESRRRKSVQVVFKTNESL